MQPTEIGPYRIIRPLGEGGMGVVYEAIQDPIGRRVALKVLLPHHATKRHLLTRFFNEARAVNMIEHPNIVQVSDYGQTADGTAYLVMEYLRGETLSSRLARIKTVSGSMSILEATAIATQIVDALTAAHEKAIVHRDLKPANIMLVPDPVAQGGERAKILDFGIAKLAVGAEIGTATNAVMGTPQYMSPEQCRGAKGVDDKTDVYALGVMFYEMLSGRPPFQCESAIEYMGQHIFDQPAPLAGLAPRAHPDLLALVHRLLNKDKCSRPTMRQVGHELSRIVPLLAEEPASVPPSISVSVDNVTTRRSAPSLVSPPTLDGSQKNTPHAGRRRQREVLVVAGGLVAFAVVSLAVRQLSRSPSPRATTSSPPEEPTPRHLLSTHAVAPPVSIPAQPAPSRPQLPPPTTKTQLIAPEPTAGKPPAAILTPIHPTSGSSAPALSKPASSSMQAKTRYRTSNIRAEAGPSGKPPSSSHSDATSLVQYED